MKKTVRKNEKLKGVEVLFDSDLTSEQKDVIYNDLGLHWSKKYQHFWAKDPDGKVYKAIMKSFIGDLEDITEAPVKTTKMKKTTKAAPAKAETKSKKQPAKKKAAGEDLLAWKSEVLERVTAVLDDAIASLA